MDAQGVLVGYPAAADEDCTVWVELPDKPDEWEGILARRTEPDRAELVGIPLFAYGINLGDEITLKGSGDGPAVAAGVVTDGGNYTFRVLFGGAADPGEHWKRLMLDLEPYGCWFDTWSERFVGVSASSENAQAVADYFAQRELVGELRYETGRTLNLREGLMDSEKS